MVNDSDVQEVEVGNLGTHKCNGSAKIYGSQESKM